MIERNVYCRWLLRWVNYNIPVDKINNYTIIGGKKYNNKIIFFTIDPQILIPINVESKQKLIIHFNYDDLYVNGGELLENTISDSEIKSLKDELQMVYNSRSWKMTKWYRRLRDLIKNWVILLQIWNRTILWYNTNDMEGLWI